MNFFRYLKCDVRDNKFVLYSTNVCFEKQIWCDMQNKFAFASGKFDKNITNFFLCESNVCIIQNKFVFKVTNACL